MLSKFTNLYFPICSLAVSFFLFFLFFSKKNIKNSETKIYSKLIIVGLIESILYTSICFSAHFILNESNYLLFEIMNKVIYSIYIIWFSLLFYYSLLLHFAHSIKKVKYFKSIISCIDIILITLILILKVEIFFDKTSGLSNSYGASANVLFFGIGLYVLAIFSITIIDYKNIKKKKYYPLLALIVLMIVTLIIRIIDPLFSIYSNVLSFTLLIMYHTIENPDIKMLEELHQAKEVSDNSNEEKTMFLYNMTNEIRTIIRDIDKSADNILDETDNKKINIENINDNTRDIKASTAKFITITNEILDISSIDTANIKVYNEKYNIKLILKELITISKNKIGDKNITFRSEIATDIPEYLYGDSVGLKTVLNTVLDNAIKYTTKGYVELRVDAITKKDVCRLIITIEDSGLGIKSEEIEKVFNKHKRELDGDNLKTNLYAARKVLTLMGGTLIPSSTYGSGTTMKIVLDQKIVESTSKMATLAVTYDQKKILVVDDNEASIKIINKYLKDTSIQIESVKLGKECLDKIRNKEKYDLILLDEEMSPLNGIEVMQKLNQIRTFNTKVVLLTKNTHYEYSDDHLKYGFTDCLVKPLTKEKLLEKLNKYL